MKARLLPIIILVIIGFFGLGLEAERHGKKKKGKHSIWNTLIAHALQWGLILWAIL